MDLRDRRVLITGASSGIGAEAARHFAQAGAQVVLLSEREEELNAVAYSIQRAGGQAAALVVDLSHPEQVEGLISHVEQQVGPVDILINNAGVGLGATVLETKPADLRFLFEVNFFALAELCRQALAAMAPRGRGHIINVSSAASVVGGPTISTYAATKGAIHAFTQSLRIEASACGVSVSEVLPISVKTGFFESVKGKKYRPGGIVLSSESVARSIVRCAASARPAPEVLPYGLIRIVFVLNALMPVAFARFAAKRYARSTEQKEAQK